GLDHVAPGTLLVLDEPGDLAEAGAFLWRQADERRAELIGAGDLPKDWPSTYLPPRDWKGRLVASRTLELTWESEPAEDAAMARGALSSGDPFGWRGAVPPPRRARRPLDAVATSGRPAAPDASWMPGPAGAPMTRGSCSPRTRRPVLRTSSGRAGCRSRSWTASTPRRAPERSR